MTAISWAGLAMVIALGIIAVVVRTRWLQSHTLAKCVAISAVLHALLAVVCGFVGGWSPASWGRNDEGRMTMLVAIAEEPVESDAVADAAEEVDDAPQGETADAEPAPPPPALLARQPTESAPADLVPLLEPPAPSAAEDAAAALAETAAMSQPAAAPVAANRVPDVYADRVGARRAVAAAARGGSQETERAVEAALAWLAAAQAADGRWTAPRPGGAAPRPANGQHRTGAGAGDHGVTGLALLAFLGAGNTHREGPHAGCVDRGLRFLLGRQRADGSLAGDAEFFAALYSHGMATIAVAECLALSGDAALRPALDRGVAHTLAMQHPHTGGWRYAAGDRGDTSQLGWQVMVLASSRNAGLGGFEAAEAGARRFLESVSSGAAGGLAAYRPGERPNMAMTAEALYCRLVLGMPATHPSAVEAVALLAATPPSSAGYNSYAWYYATLASFHAGGSQWEEWNRRLQAALLPLQHRDGGSLDGSWDPDPVWGGHGGRVYSTALSALTLEVYYRHEPLHRRESRMAAAARQPGVVTP
jgi:hypothetical protein